MSRKRSSKLWYLSIDSCASLFRTPEALTVQHFWPSNCDMLLQPERFLRQSSSFFHQEGLGWMGWQKPKHMGRAENVWYRGNLRKEKNSQNAERKWERRHKNWKRTGNFHQMWPKISIFFLLRLVPREWGTTELLLEVVRNRWERATTCYSGGCASTWGLTNVT